MDKSSFQQAVRVILDHAKATNGWSMADLSEQVVLPDEQRPRFYRWLRRAAAGMIVRPHTDTKHFEEALRGLIGGGDSLFTSSSWSVQARLTWLRVVPVDTDDLTLIHRFSAVLRQARRTPRREEIERQIDQWSQSSSEAKVDTGLSMNADPPAGRPASTKSMGSKADLLTQQRRDSDATKASKSVGAVSKMTELPVVVKWTGSKRRQAAEILRHFPKQIETYYEPFLGGASLLLGLLLSGTQVKRFRCSDISAPLIEIWNVIRDDPGSLNRYYECFWNEIQRRGESFYYETRTKFNDDQDPLKFFALLRTCRNGWVQFNKKAHFNSGFHHQRTGIRPERLRSLVNDCSARLNAVDVQFEVKDYRSVESSERDFLYLDPPYEMPEDRRAVMYTGDFDLSAMWPWLEKQPGSYALSLSGFRGEEDRRIDVPRHLYDVSLLIDNPNAFQRMTARKASVRDSLYVRLKQPVETQSIGETKREGTVNQETDEYRTGLDDRILTRIKDRLRAAKNEGGDPSDGILSDLLAGRKGDPTKGISALPKLHNPTAKWHTSKVRAIVTAKIGAGMSPEQAIDQMLDDFKKRGHFKADN